MLADSSDSEIRIQLWDSFLSLLKSYAAAASLHGVRHEVVAVSECEAFVTAGTRVLDIWCYPDSGRGDWAIGRSTAESAGEFLLNTNGTIALGDSTMDMDHAAIQLIASLTTAARLDEVPA